MKLVRRKQLQETVELNITAFMNLMVILVPFLLITAVFSRMTVLELNLPALDAMQRENDNSEVKLQLQVVIRPNAIILRDANLGVLKKLNRSADEINWKIFTKVLLEVKTRFPEEKGIALLLDKSVSYKTLIQVMDRVKSADVVEMVSVVNVELFPNVSIGDAPEETVSGPPTVGDTL